MRATAYFVTLVLGLVSVGLSVALIIVARGNRNIQQEIQAQQTALNNSVLGAQGQQISGSMLQDVANAAAANKALRELLTKYGYRVEPARTPAAAGAEAGGALPAPVKPKPESP